MPDFTKGGAAALAQNSPVDLLLQRLDGARQVGPDKWLARCPAHDDRSPSLGVRRADDGRALLKCWAGCGVEAVVAALGLELSDLFPLAHGRDFDPTAPRPKIPRYSAAELLPLVVTEATILALSWRTVADGGELSDADRARAELAHEAVMAAYAEVCHGR